MSREADEEILEGLKRNIRRRITAVCNEWSETERENLVNQIAVNELRFPPSRRLAQLSYVGEVGIHSLDEKQQ